MLSEKIKENRRKRNLSQEELGVKLNVVRQTVSKWENNLSVPDADMLIKISKVLDVSVAELLELETDKNDSVNLAEELARLNKVLAEKSAREKLVARADKIRGAILGLTFLSLLVALMFKNQIISLILMTVCVVASLIVLYRNIGVLTAVTSEKSETKYLKITTAFNIIFFAACAVVAVLIGTGFIVITEENEDCLGVAVITALIIFSGIISPKLPFNRHTGLRLPWTVRDEQTWNLAHKVIGIISFPMSIIYVAGVIAKINFEFLFLSVTALWIGIPAVISYVFFKKKY